MKKLNCDNNIHPKNKKSNLILTKEKIEDDDMKNVSGGEFVNRSQNANVPVIINGNGNIQKIDGGITINQGGKLQNPNQHNNSHKSITDSTSNFLNAFFDGWKVWGNKMKSKEEFKKKYENGDFNEILKNVKSPEDVVKVANSYGYELTVEDVMNAELSDDLLLSVAGGKGDKTTNNTYNYTITGDNNKQAIL